MIDTPSVARIYDYILGGSHNFPIDRETAERIIAANPDLAVGARVNRAFLRRAVRFLLDRGIDQFLDVGSGIPTAGNVHEIAHAANPAARIVYVDVDPVAVHYSLAILENTPSATAIQADAHRPDQILNHPRITDLLDFSRPVAVLLVALLHFILDDAQAQEVARTFRERLGPGSYLVVAHGTMEAGSLEAIKRGEEAIRQTSTPIKYRGRVQVSSFFDGLEMVEPGLVHAPLWRPEGPDDLLLEQPERSLSLVGAGYRR